jgi:alkylation response protein AidB-like acyl-CoA dehydrogenase
MDVRLSPEQIALRDSAAQVADRLGLHAVADLDDTERAAKLDAAVTASGWRELRAASDEGTPWASAVEVAVVAEELGRGLADTAFLGPTLAADLRRLAGLPSAAGPETVVLTADLADVAVASDGVVPAAAVAVDAAGATSALVLATGADGWGIGAVALDGDAAGGAGVDMTRPAGEPGAGRTVTPLETSSPLGEDVLTRWRSLGLAVTSADLVGVMRGAVTLSADYARDRKQYGASIGSFQAVQHLLADALVAMEGSRSIALHAAWAIDAMPPGEAFAAAAAAKAYCTRAARAVCETAIQVHGGIGNTWECLAHVFLRRALLSGDVFGGVGVNLELVLAAHGVGGADGLR